MRPAVEDMTVSDWMQAKTAMGRSAFSNLVKVAKAGGVPLPAFLAPNFSPRIVFESLDEQAQYQRVKDVEALTAFNDSVNKWAKKVEDELKASAQSSFGHRDNASHLQPHLADSIKANVRKDKKFKLETRSIGFSIARHGVHLHRGAGEGYGGFTGSKWTDKYGNIKSTSENSLGKMDTGNRQAVHWFNDVINRNIEELIGIVADYTLDITINLSSILLSE